MIEPVEITTPSGYHVFLKPFLPYGAYLTVQKTIMAGIEIDAQTQQIVKLDAGLMLEGNEKALELLLVKVVDPQGAVAASPLQTVLEEFPPGDGQYVMDEVDRITQAATPAKKGVLSKS